MWVRIVRIEISLNFMAQTGRTIRNTTDGGDIIPFQNWIMRVQKNSMNIYSVSQKNGWNHHIILMDGVWMWRQISACLRNLITISGKSFVKGSKTSIRMHWSWPNIMVILHLGCRETSGIRSWIMMHLWNRSHGCWREWKNTAMNIARIFTEMRMPLKMQWSIIWMRLRESPCMWRWMSCQIMIIPDFWQEPTEEWDGLQIAVRRQRIRVLM